MKKVRYLLVLCAYAIWGGIAQAQQLGVPVSEVLVLDPDRAYSASLAGQEITRSLEERLRELVAENRRLEAELEAEERELTELRPTLSVEEFRALAVAFDEKAQRIRAEQYAKQSDLNTLEDKERSRFLERLAPILSRIAQDRGALIILDKRNVLLSAGAIDITDEAVARYNATISTDTTNDVPGNE